MKPDIRKDLQLSWIIFLSTALVLIITLTIFASDSATTKRLITAQKAYKNNQQQSLLLETLVEKQRQSNNELGEQIKLRKQQVGVQLVEPFIVPEENSGRKVDHGEYFYQTWELVREELKRMAVQNYVKEYKNSSMGFSFPGDRPPKDEVENWLTMLQLVSKASWLAVNHPEREIEMVEVQPISYAKGYMTGPDGRTDLLREFPFTLKVRGSLRSILWLIHELSADTIGDVQRETVASRALDSWLRGLVRRINVTLKIPDRKVNYNNTLSPLIVTGLRIQTEDAYVDIRRLQDLANSIAVNERLAVQLDATIRIAGMSFVDHGQRKNAESSSSAQSPLSTINSSNGRRSARL